MGMGARIQKPTEQLWLFVEDDAGIRFSLTECFKFWDIECLPFTDGRKAMAWLSELDASKIPTLAILDERLPSYGAQGHEIAQYIRSTPATQNIPVVLMTAFRYTDEER